MSTPYRGAVKVTKVPYLKSYGGGFLPGTGCLGSPSVSSTGVPRKIVHTKETVS
jgi:hypothetical protein